MIVDAAEATVDVVTVVVVVEVTFPSARRDEEMVIVALSEAATEAVGNSEVVTTEVGAEETSMGAVVVAAIFVVEVTSEVGVEDAEDRPTTALLSSGMSCDEYP